MTADGTAASMTIDSDGTLALALLGVCLVGLAVVVHRLLAQRRAILASQAALVRSEREFRILATNSPVGVFMTDATGRATYVNPLLRELVGASVDADLLSRHTLSVVVPEDRAAVATGVLEAVAQHRSYTGRARIVRADGEQRWVQIDGAPAFENGEMTGWVGTVIDVTAETAHADELRRLSEIIEKTPLYVCITDVDGHFQYLNEAGRRLYGVEPGQPLGHLRAIYSYAHSSRRTFLEEAIPAAVSDGAWSGEMVMVDPTTDTTFPASQILVAHRAGGDDVDYFFSITSDLTERKAFEARLVHHELHDGLTGLPNRLLLLDRLGQALARSERTNGLVAVLFLDVDRFKLVNDSYGHAVGDLLLQRVAARLAEAVRPGDTVARFSGDEFCIVCEDVSGEGQAVEIAHRVAAVLSAPYDVDTPAGETARVFVTVSTGIAMSRRTGATPEAMLRDADAAMYRAKETGRARHEIFTDTMRHSAVHRLRTAGDLHRALAEGEFRVVYQPEISVDAGHIVGVETLLRWHHPERGLVPPGEFIPLAEETGLIESVGEWVLDRAVAQAARWRASRWDGQPLPVWVNLSARQLSSATLVTTVAALLTTYDVRPGQIGLEITETALPDDADAAIEVLGSLRRLGVRLAIDDFGTGYSSLSYLKRLPVDAVKVDRAFVDGLGHDADDSAIVNAVIGMARALRLTTIAEGVETATQIRSLRALGCDVAQGYYFSVPQPPDHLTRLLEADRGRGLWAPDSGGRGAGPLRLVRPLPGESPSRDPQQRDPQQHDPQHGQASSVGEAPSAGDAAGGGSGRSGAPGRPGR